MEHPSTTGMRDAENAILSDPAHTNVTNRHADVRDRCACGWEGERWVAHIVEVSEAARSAYLREHGVLLGPDGLVPAALLDEVERLHHERDALARKAEADEGLRERLASFKPYAWHLHTCDTERGVSEECTCGFDAVCAQWEAAEHAPLYACTRCGWCGTDPEPQRNGDHKCPRCPYAVAEVPRSTETEEAEALTALADAFGRQGSLTAEQGGEG